MIHTDQLIHIFFGNKTNAVSKNKLLQKDEKSLLLMSPFDVLKKEFNLKSAFFVNQVHGADGRWILRCAQDDASACNDNVLLRHSTSLACNPKPLLCHREPSLCHPERSEGSTFLQDNSDFLITNNPNTGIGILTADCLPIIMVDTQRHAIGIAHAGWRGSVQKIGPIMLQALQKHFNTKADTITVYFGPSILPCCYEVDKTFKENREKELAEKTIITRNNKFYFDLTLYNKLLLMQAGIPEEHFVFTYNKCTACTPGYCSYRKEKDDDLRQITLVSLK